MLAPAESTRSLELRLTTNGRHPLDAYVADPSGLEPLCEEDECSEIVEEMVADEAPRLFAVVQVYGERVDAQIAAWGMAFEDHAEVVSVTGTRRMSLPAPERALRRFTVGTHVRARIVWFNPEAATAVKGNEAA